MAEEFKRLDRKLVYHGTIIDYYRDTIQVPNGNIAEWDFIGHKGAAAVVPVREDGKLLMCVSGAMLSTVIRWKSRRAD